jgi:hypothetical protein
MEIKNLFADAEKEALLSRINKLTPASKALWGKMDVAQMLAHLQLPILTAYGKHIPKGSFMLRLIGPLFKSMLWNNKPWKQGLPTDPTFITSADPANFENEKSKMLDLLIQFSPEALVAERHPIFGKFTKDNWSMATWKHIDHHLRQFGV